MDFECKYPLTQDKNNFILAEWTKGYRQVRLSSRDREIAVFENGLKYTDRDFITKDSQLGEIRVRFTKQPIQMDIIVDGLHSPLNRKHPEKSFKSLSNFFFICAGIVSIPILWLVIGSFMNPRSIPLALISLLLLLVFASLYYVIGFFIKKGKVIAYYLGVALVVLNLIGLLMSRNFFFLFWAGCLVYLLTKLTVVISYGKHAKFLNSNVEILD